MWPHQPSGATPNSCDAELERRLPSREPPGALRRIEQGLCLGLPGLVQSGAAPLCDRTDWGLLETLPEFGSQGQGYRGPKAAHLLATELRSHPICQFPGASPSTGHVVREKNLLVTVNTKNRCWVYAVIVICSGNETQGLKPSQGSTS
ncbi:uncharacterized protein LOC121827463 [Peromyscus maniculatus bairdii]|uniref:uncharacterized protein LOC121827463 n=1 Tax=Peromyscus maniculatus bairdii TaxID=230844 RepID=UPI003FCF3F18